MDALPTLPRLPLKHSPSGRSGGWQAWDTLHPEWSPAGPGNRVFCAEAHTQAGGTGAEDRGKGEGRVEYARGRIH